VPAALVGAGAVGTEWRPRPQRPRTGLPWVARSRGHLASVRGLSERAAAELLGVGLDASPEELRRAFCSRARAAHPDGGGSAEAFAQLREAYVHLQHQTGALPSASHVSATATSHASEAAWAAWEEEVRRGRELAGEGDAIYWRPEPSEPWRPAVVLAVQVVYEPSSGPHGWMYLQPLVQEATGGFFQEDEDAEMEQVEPLSPDGVNWYFARLAVALGEGRWQLGPRPPLP